DKIRVVCGAPNHKVGDIVPLALPGTKFSEEFVIVKSKIRGEESNGMLCSARELQFSDEHSGIMILPPDTKLGVPLSDLFGDRIDIRFEIDNKSVTHRPDLWGHIGFARELGAIFDRKIKNPVKRELASSFKSVEKLSVSIECPDAAPRYCGLVVKNVKIAESPEWLKQRVTAIGMRPINNIVDITNYVMAELGEPMHAFDRKKFGGDTILVRLARKGEKITTLDGIERNLHEEDVVITDGKNPIAIAGVMGGGNSEIDDNTTELILEAANFNAVSVRKTAFRHVLRTDAAMRYEKSLDPEICPDAIVRCFELIKMVCPEAEAQTQIIDVYPKKAQPITISITTDTIRRKLGAPLTDERITEIISSLGFDLKNSNGTLTIGVPSYRATKDISIPADIVEEVGRIYGYDNIAPEAPLVPCSTPHANVKRMFERTLKTILTRDHRMIEVSNYSFTGEDILNKVGINEDKELRLRNPLASDQDRLRRTLVPGIITDIELNERFNDSFRIFELGRVYLKDSRTSSDLIAERSFITGAFYRKSDGEPVFYQARAVIEDLVSQLNLKSVRFDPATDKLPVYAHSGRSLRLVVDGKDAGLIFELHPATKSAFGIKGNAALIDIDIEILLNASRREKKFDELPRFPDVPYEISVIADRTVYAETIADIIRKTNRERIRSVEVFSVYEGAPIPEGKKSVSYRIIFAAKDATLASQEIESLQKSVLDALQKKGFTLR
ncbi:MAG TPA: phenylalanine--tRNA ligase subunit beta, partial [Spirochaetota bacterium]|nr:phenylalanine--tRNA ligase subunit beta [Spirochaetota bacterium]